MSAAVVARLEGVSFSYGGPLVLDGVDLVIHEGDFVGLIGPNGGGKSTLLRILLGLLEPARGRVTLFGSTPERGRRAVGYVPQRVAFAGDFPISVEQTVLLGRLGWAPACGGYRARDREAARRAMEAVEVADLAGRRLGTLSGGQAQRVLLARALASEPRMLILDEPTANIDLRVEGQIFELLRRLRERMTILVVSHDVGFISEYVTQVMCLNRTLVTHPTAELTGAAIEELYGEPVRLVRHAHRDGGEEP